MPHLKATGSIRPDLLILALALLPVLFNPTLAMSADPVLLEPKLLLLLAVILPVSLWTAWTLRHAPDRTLWAVLGFWITWVVLGSVVGYHAFVGWLGLPGSRASLPVYLTYACVLLSFYAWATQGRLGTFFPAAMSVLLVVLGLYVVYEFYGLGRNPLFNYPVGHRGYLAGLVAVLLPLASAYARHHRLGIVAVFACGFILVAALTRGALLAALAGYAYWLWFSKSTWRAPGHIALVAGLVLPFVPLVPGQLPVRAFSLGTAAFDSEQGQGVADDSQRALLWNSALVGIKGKPLLGWGPGQLVEVMATRPDTQLLQEKKVTLDNKQVVRLSRQSGQVLTWRLVRPDGTFSVEMHGLASVHNEYLQYSLDFGLPAGLAFFLLLTVGVWRGRQLPWAGAGTLAYAIYLLTWPETLRFAPVAWAILGVAWAQRPTTFHRVTER